MSERLVKSFQDLGREYFGPQFSADQCVAEAMEDIQKAMASTAMAGMGDATPLRLENLDATMTSVLITRKHLKLFNWFERVPSTQLIYQYTRRLSYGSSRSFAGFREGGTPRGGVSAFRRDNATIRFMGVRRGITHPLTVMGAAGGTQIDPVRDEQEAGTLELLEKIERAILWGRQDVADENGNTVNYDGLIRQMEQSAQANTNIVDMEGRYLTFDDIEECGYRFFNDAKVADFSGLKFWMRGDILGDMSRLKFDIDRRTLGATVAESYQTGLPLAGHRTNFGLIPFEPHIFMDPVEGCKPVANAGEPGAPASPTAVAGAAGPAGGDPSKMEAGTYWYHAAAFNESGESLPVTAMAGTVVDSDGLQVTVTIDRVAGAVGYRLYRGTTANPADSGIIATIPQTPMGNAVYVDLNQWRPNHGLAFAIHRDPENVAIAQLLPLIKFPLAITSTTVEFLLLLYHVFVLKAPERCIIYKNVGRYPGA